MGTGCWFLAVNKNGTSKWNTLSEALVASAVEIIPKENKKRTKMNR